jgi:hypothetical protein
LLPQAWSVAYEGRSDFSEVAFIASFLHYCQGKHGRTVQK